MDEIEREEVVISGGNECISRKKKSDKEYTRPEIEYREEGHWRGGGAAEGDGGEQTRDGEPGDFTTHVTQILQVPFFRDRSSDRLLKSGCVSP